MNRKQFARITSRYRDLRIAVVGDFCLDRYLEIDPARSEVSIETGLEVHNVVRVRSQPGGAGTILNNLVALGVGEIFAVGFCGDDGEGFELRRSLTAQRGVDCEHFLATSERRTFTYCKPLLMHPGRPPEELNRLDSKNWSPTPEALQQDLARRLLGLATEVDAIILLDQVDEPETGAVTRPVAAAAQAAVAARPNLLVLADSRRGLAHYPPLGFKMNAAEMAKLSGAEFNSFAEMLAFTHELAINNNAPVFVTLAERGILGATPKKPTEHVVPFPVRGPIDIVGAGDAVMANLAAALAAGASAVEAMELAMAAASVVIHQLGTTGTATTAQLAELLDEH